MEEVEGFVILNEDNDTYFPYLKSGIPQIFSRESDAQSRIDKRQQRYSRRGGQPENLKIVKVNISLIS